MAGTPGIAATVGGIVAGHIPRVRTSAAADYWALTKPEVNVLIIVATGAACSSASRKRCRSRDRG